VDATADAEADEDDDESESLGDDTDDGQARAQKLNLRQHVCRKCGKRFNRPSSLKIHLNTHSGAQREFPLVLAFIGFRPVWFRVVSFRFVSFRSASSRLVSLLRFVVRAKGEKHGPRRSGSTLSRH
jgi:hypothetical protein